MHSCTLFIFLRCLPFILGDIAEKHVTVSWSVSLFLCLFRSCIVLKRQKIYTRFLLHTTASCLSQCKNLAYISQPLHPEILPKVIHSGWFETFDGIVYRKLPELFQMVPSLTPKTSLKMWVPCKCTPGQNSQGVLPPGECDRRYRQVMSPFAKLPWPLAIILCIATPFELLWCSTATVGINGIREVIFFHMIRSPHAIA